MTAGLVAVLFVAAGLVAVGAQAESLRYNKS